MALKGNPYPSRESSPRPEPSSPRQNNEAHKSPYESRGLMGDLLMGPKKLPEFKRPEPRRASLSKANGIFDEKGRVASKIFKKEVEAYDSHVDLSRKEREGMAKEIIDGHKIVEKKAVKDYLKDLKHDNPNPDLDTKIEIREMKELLDKKMGKK